MNGYLLNLKRRRQAKKEDTDTLGDDRMEERLDVHAYVCTHHDLIPINTIGDNKEVTFEETHKKIFIQSSNTTISPKPHVREILIGT